MLKDRPTQCHFTWLVPLTVININAIRVLIKITSPNT